ncbi:glycosyl transferase family 2 [Methylophaga nitratireducenticrescens]|uniref:Glycosyltransferase n=1 Tax=Methylophaga nitratireducenticrescens TaxID=754476 RepID=I1XHR5_METNJ|nr:glycosyltransferase family 2 protein [Methylophaga nitratireducenticrescens]AFI83934.1 glycosyl transferase family 2 [Methylophaga nitratireducenticrescens]
MDINSNIKFSVIIPCFNSSKTISRALGSLLHQSEQNFEVVIVDDASDDLTELEQVIAQYARDISIKFVQNHRNMNAAFSRNKGMNLARGEYIAFLDSDDTWPSNRLESAVKIIENISDAQFIIYGQFELIGSHKTGALLPIRGIRRNELVSEYVFAAGQHMQTSTFILPVGVAKDVLFDETLSRHQDSDLMMRAQKKGIKLIFQQEKCADYYFRPDDLHNRVISGRINSDFCRQWIKVKNHYFSDSASAGYTLTTFSRVKYMEGHVFQSFKLAISSLTKIGLLNFLDLYKTKMIILYKTRFGL